MAQIKKNIIEKPLNVTKMGTVIIKIKYPVGYEGPRFFEDGGSYEVSVELAEIFIALGIVDQG